MPTVKLPGLPTDRHVKPFSCIGCVFWCGCSDGATGKDGAPLVSTTGDCHRLPPTLGADGITKWPHTFYFEWCGEFKAPRENRAAA